MTRRENRSITTARWAKPFLGPDVGDVCHPCPVRRIDIELPGQGIVDHDRRFATIGAGPTLVADLGSDRGKPCKAGNAVRTTGLSLIQKVVMQLAVAVDLPLSFQALLMSSV